MEEIDIRELIKILLEKKLFIIIMTLIFMVAAYVYNAHYTKPLYNSSATLLLAKTTEDTNASGYVLEEKGITQSDVMLNEKLVSTYSELAKSNGVISKVIENLKLNISHEELKSSISVSEVTNTEILKISVSNKDGKLSATIVNELSKVFIDRIQELYNISNIKVVDSGVESRTPYNINPSKYSMMGALIGFTISIAIIVLIIIIKNAVRTVKQVEQNTKIPVLATIGKDRKNNSDELIAYVNSRSVIGETFRGIRTNLKFYNKDCAKVIAITSSVPEEGKSWVSSNLATVFAKNNEKVLLIDADMKRGRQHKVFNLTQMDGLKELLENNDIDNINKYINATNIENLSVLTCGNFTQDSSELLLTGVFEKVLDVLRNDYDVIIVDTTPNSLVTDGIIISRLVDTNVIVTKYNSTNLDTVDKTVNDIKRVGGNILGIIINQMHNMNKKYEELYYGNSEIAVRKITNFNSHAKTLKDYF